MKSYSNVKEAEMVVELVRYAVRQGYQTKEIALLTPYTGQLLCLIRLLSAQSITISINERDAADLDLLEGHSLCDLGGVEIDEEDSDEDETDSDEEVASRPKSAAMISEKVVRRKGSKKKRGKPKRAANFKLKDCLRIRLSPNFIGRYNPQLRV